MPSSTFTFCQNFSEALGTGVHNLASNTFKIALSNTAPNLATMAVLADITQISSGGGYTGGAGGGFTLTSPTYTETGGTATFDGTSTTLTASGGSFGPFRYAWLYNDTAASDPLIGVVDYGSSITVNDGESFEYQIPTSIFTVS